MQCNVIYAGNSSSRFSGGQHRPLCLALQWIQCSLPSEYQRPERRVILVIFRSWSFLWLKQCHFRHPMTRNGLYMFYTTYKHGDDWKMVYKVYDLWLFYQILPTWFSIRLFKRHLCSLHSPHCQNPCWLSQPGARFFASNGPTMETHTSHDNIW